MSAPSSIWTDDRVDALTRQWREGFSASQIARSLGSGITRNAVIGKVHRLGLSGRASPRLPGAGRPDQRRERRGRLPRPLAPVQRAAPPADPPPAPDLPSVGLATVVSVRLRQCRWPMGDPGAEGFCLCGRAAVRGAYCAAHGALAYRPTDPKHLLKLARLR